MELLRYSYVIESQFSAPIGYHAFKLRCLPSNVCFQRTVEQAVSVSPQCQLLQSTDSFGNSVIYGSISEPHRQFRLESRGVVERLPYLISDRHPSDLFSFPSSLTAWDSELRQWASNRNAEDIMHVVHSHVAYERFVTNNATTALDVFHGRRGVCQDLAHLMIAACRAAGMHARYANGIMTGEGETHAWVEVNDGTQWRGYDPTHDRMVDSSYIKFAHGRDVNDCPTNRGRMYQWTMELMTVNCVATTILPDEQTTDKQKCFKR